MANPKGKARMYFEDDEGNMIKIEAEGEPPISGPLEFDHGFLPEDVKHFLNEFRARVFTASAIFSFPKPLLQPGTPFSYN